MKMIQSKKFVAGVIASLLSFFAIRAGMSTDQVALIVGPLVVSICAQGLADVGKESAIIRANGGPIEKEQE